MDVAQVSDLVQYPLRLDYEKPSPPWPPADLVLVAPATINSVNKFTAGIADSVALGLLRELFGVDVPVVMAPNVNPALARHPRFRKSIEKLRAWAFTSCSTTLPRSHLHMTDGRPRPEFDGATALGGCCRKPNLWVARSSVPVAAVGLR
jgi:hypothetical protein